MLRVCILNIKINISDHLAIKGRKDNIYQTKNLKNHVYFNYKGIAWALVRSFNRFDNQPK